MKFVTSIEKKVFTFRNTTIRKFPRKFEKSHKIHLIGKNLDKLKDHMKFKTLFDASLKF
jgi:hypothetical protein